MTQRQPATRLFDQEINNGSRDILQYYTMLVCTAESPSQMAAAVMDATLATKATIKKLIVAMFHLNFTAMRAGWKNLAAEHSHRLSGHAKEACRQRLEAFFKGLEAIADDLTPETLEDPNWYTKRCLSNLCELFPEFADAEITGEALEVYLYDKELMLNLCDEVAQESPGFAALLQEEA